MSSILTLSGALHSENKTNKAFLITSDTPRHKKRNEVYNMDLLLIGLVIVLVIAFSAFIVIQQNKFKSLSQISHQQAQQGQVDLSERERLLKKEAMIAAKEALQLEQEKLNEEIRERRQEIARTEDKLAKREDMLEDKVQEATEKDLQAQKKLDDLLEKEDYLADLVQKQTT